MTAYTQDQIMEILAAHKKWGTGEEGGKRAYLQGADLRDANLQGANLQGADLQYANLQGASLQGANLQGADLQYADLQYADLQYADLQRANLQGASLQGAKVDGSSWIATDIRLSDLIEVIPALFTGGGRTVEQVVTREAMTCHSWSNCPMAEAFHAQSIGDIPLAWRPWASLFIWAFDSRLLTTEQIAEACGVTLAPEVTS